MKKEKVIVICGPTASGKTALSIELAKKINGEIISCDSMQIYKYMDIGTAKPTPEEQKEVKHHLIDFVEPDQRYSVAEYKKDAEKSIEEILAKGKTLFYTIRGEAIRVRFVQFFSIKANAVCWNRISRNRIR